MRISLTLGPGHHGDRLVGLLAERGHLERVIRYWPDFRVDQGRRGAPGLVSGSARPAYGHACRLAWALWRRLPVIGGWETPRAPLFALFDALAETELTPCDLFVGWAQMSLRCLRRARRLGARTLLEHPMAHVDAWMPLYREEYARWGRARRGGYSLIPEGLARRMREEYAAADRISVLSSYARRTFLAAGVPLGRIVQIPLGVDAELFRPGPPRGRGPLRVLFVGRLELVKGVQYLLEAAVRLGREVELWLVGPLLPEVAPLLERAERRRAPGLRIRRLGEVPPAQLPHLYRQADALCLPTLNDAFGLVLLEAMATGLPVVATDRSGAPDLIHDGEEGFVVGIRDAEALAERLARLAADREAARQMGQRGRARVLSGFTWAHYAERILTAYGALAQQKQGDLRYLVGLGEHGDAGLHEHALPR